MSLPKMIKLSQTVWELLEIHSGEVTSKQPQRGLSFLHAAHLLVLIYASTKYYQNISNH